MRGHGRLLTAAGLITAGALAGCSGAAGTSQGTATATHELPPATPGTSAATPTSSSAATTSTTSATAASPTATSAAAPAIPAAARAHTPEGAEAYTRYFIDQVNVAWTTPKTGLISALSLPTCKSCEAFEQGARDLTAANTKYANATLKATETTAGTDKKSGGTVVVVTLVETQAASITGNRTIAATEAPKSSRNAFDLVPSSEGWKISEIKDFR